MSPSVTNFAALSPAEQREFVRQNTRLQSPTLLPELRLHLADEVTPLWRLTEEALGDLGLPPPFWAFAWAGGQGIARYLLDHPHEAKDRRMVDLATGSGLVAIAAMKSGAKAAVGIDIDRFCAPAVALNAKANGVTVQFRVEDVLNGPPPDADLVTAGDVGYERPMAEAMRAYLFRAYQNGARVLLGDPGRTYFDAKGLVKLGEYRAGTTLELEDQEVKRTDVWTFAD